jgi:hypothetical protein
MRKPVPVCPKCGADQRESPALKAPPASERKSRAAKAATPVVEEAEAADADLDADDAEGEDEDDDGEDDDDA